MNPVNQTTYYVEEKGWFTSSLRPVTKEAFRAHLAEKRASSVLNHLIKTLALGILAATHSLRFSMSRSNPAAQLALPTLGLHAWSHIPTACAQTLGPQGDEFQVNTYTPGYQTSPSVAVLSGGGFVVTWGSSGQDGSDHGVYGQLFDGKGVKVGIEFPINTYTSDGQSGSAVAALSAGGFVVVWTSEGQDGSNYGVYGQRFDGVGGKVEREFQINTYTRDAQMDPSVAGLEGGGFVVAWQSDGQDGDFHGVFGQRFDVAGRKLGSEFQINTLTVGLQTLPIVVPLAGESFVVVWHSRIDPMSSDVIYGQLFDGAGRKSGTELLISNHGGNLLQGKSVAALSRGGFVVTWTDGHYSGDDRKLFGQRFSRNGVQIGDEFLVDNSGNSGYPSVATLSGNGFIVVWGRGLNSGLINYELYGQRFDGAGWAVGSEFQVNTFLAGPQTNPSVAELRGGEFVVTWQSDGQDGEDYGIYGRLFLEKVMTSYSPPTTSRSLTAPETSPPQIKDSKRIQSVRATIGGEDRRIALNQGSSQTALIAWIGGVTAMACSLFSGSLFWWLRKKGKEESSPSAEQGNPNVGVPADSPGRYVAFAVNRSHYKDWPKHQPVHDKSHYHQDLEELNQQMAQRYPGDSEKKHPQPIQVTPKF